MKLEECQTTSFDIGCGCATVLHYVYVLAMHMHMHSYLGVHRQTDGWTARLQNTSVLSMHTN